MFYVNGLNLYLLYIVDVKFDADFYCPSSFEKRHSYLSKISLPNVYWVIDKDISVKMSFTLVWSVISLVDISSTTKQCDFVLRSLPIVTTSTIWILVNRILL